MHHPGTMRTALLAFCTALLLPCSPAKAQHTIYGFAIGNWRNGPVVEVSPLFATTELYTTPQLLQWARQQWPASFTDSTDMDVLRFATPEEGAENRATLIGKYGLRRLEVHLIEAAAMPGTPARPTRVPPPTGAPR